MFPGNFPFTLQPRHAFVSNQSRWRQQSETRSPRHQNGAQFAGFLRGDIIPVNR